MNNCPLCNDVLKETCSDIGPKIHIQCPKCGNYEASREAIGHIQSFGIPRKDEFKITIQNLNKRKESAEITVVEKDGTKIISARKISYE